MITDHVTFTMVVMYLWSKSVSILCYLNISNTEILSLNYNTKLLYCLFMYVSYFMDTQCTCQQYYKWYKMMNNNVLLVSIFSANRKKSQNGGGVCHNYPTLQYQQMG